MKNVRQFLNRYERRGPVSLPICAIGLLLLTSPIMADKSNSESGLAVLPDGGVDRIGLFSDEYDEEVIVNEGPIIRRQVGRTKLGFPIEVIELKQRVSYADLDLSREADVTVFELRVETAAKRSCEELAYRHSVEFMDRRAIMRCTNEAVDRSVEQMQAAMAANRAAIAANR